MIKAFEKAHPKVTVKDNWIQSDYEQKLQVSIAGGQAPTVSQISNTSLAGFASSYADAKVDNSSYYAENIPNSMKVGGKYAATPFVVKTKVMAVNGKVFDAAGVPRPSDTKPMSIDEYTALAKQVTSGSGATKVFGSAPLWFDGFLTASGGGWFNNAGTKCTIGDSTSVSTAHLVLKAQAADGFAPTPADTNGQDMFDWLSIGRLAMQPDFGPWDISKLVALNSKDIYLAPVPGKGEPMEIDGLGISKTATGAAKTAAQEFVSFMSTDPAAQNLLTTTSSSLGVPVIKGSVSTFEKAAPDLKLSNFVNAVSQSVVQPSVKNITQIQSAFWNDMNAKTAFGSGTQDPADVMPALQQTCQSSLSQ
jgi:ABC-type glycerol-3-phosphate transport system substrate-binding protein